MRWIVALFLVSLTGGDAAAQPANDRFAAGGPEAFAALGMLVVEGRADENICTAVLIAPDRVLTAAHCLVDQVNGTWVTARRVEFFAGQDGARYTQKRRARQILGHPRFDPALWSEEDGLRFFELLDAVETDIAVVELARPIRNIAPLPVSDTAAFAGPVAMYGYADESGDRLKPYSGCLLLYRAEDSVSLTCEVEPGVSGAPMLGWHEGQWQIFGVASLIRFDALVGTIGPRATVERVAALEDMRRRETRAFNSGKRSGKRMPKK